MKSINTLFNALRLNNGALWLDNGTIKLSTPLNLRNQETKDFVIRNKGLIISILRENKIHSKEKFLSTIIFKDCLTTAYPLSHGQERLWFIEQCEQGTNAYHMPMVVELAPGIDMKGIEYALREIVKRHHVLRSTIEIGDHGKGVQVVLDDEVGIEKMSLSDQGDLDSVLEEDINKPFDLSSQYPIRVRFYHFGPDRTVLSVNTHHIASDGWSMEIFQEELYAYYQAYVNKDKAFGLPPLGIQYKDYAIWQRSYLTGDVLEEQLDYWKGRLSGYQTLELPTDQPRPKMVDYKGDHRSFALSKDTSGKLRVRRFLQDRG